MVTSHLGRPEEGKFNENDSLQPVVEFLKNHLDYPVRLVSDWIKTPFDIAPGQLIVLENCRFNIGEKRNEDVLAKNMLHSQIFLSWMHLELPIAKKHQLTVLQNT